MEDDPEVAGFLSAALSGEYSVAVAEDGRKGLDLALKAPPDLILCDIMMPRMTGMEVLRALFHHPDLANVPVLMMTAWELEPSTRSMFESHPSVRGYIQKPVSHDVLTARVAEVLAGKAARAAAPAAAGAARRRFEVLLVDDDPADLQSLGIAVGLAHRVTTARDGLEALNHIKAITPDLVVLDMVLPRMTGLEVLRQMTSSPALSKVPVILVTAGGLIPPEVDVLLKDFRNLKRVLRKPVEAQAFQKLLRECLGPDA